MEQVYRNPYPGVVKCLEAKQGVCEKCNTGGEVYNREKVWLCARCFEKSNTIKHGQCHVCNEEGTVHYRKGYWYCRTCFHETKPHAGALNI